MPDATSAVQLCLPGFEGSAALLLNEVERGKREVEDVSVAAISAQFRDWLRERENVDLLAAGELLAAGARLASLKSAALLASPPERVAEDDWTPGASEIDPLPAKAGAWLNGQQGNESFAVVAPPASIERRVEPRSPRLLLGAFRDVERRQADTRSRLALPAFVRLEVAVSALIRRLKAGARLSLHGLLRGGSRQDAVVHFLAVLDLVRRRQAVASQTALFDDIAIEWVDHAAGADSRVG